ncbi:MAG: precorrin-6y C5,15-methyltransferase (decarboxylating) subunit CbiE [Nitrospirota bacterium]
MTSIHVIGIGNDGAHGLPAKRIAIIESADVLVGGRRHLAFFRDAGTERIEVGSNLKEVAARIDGASVDGRRVVVLASGDPLFYGLGGYLVGKLGAERVIVHPHVSAMQVAFARLGQPWHEAALVSLHAKPIEDLKSPIERGVTPIGIFTDETNTPAAIARYVIGMGGGYSASVCENLDGADERVWTGSLERMADEPFAPLNVIILRRIA